MSARHLRIEGWRGIAHSYALVNHYQCLELSRRPGIRLSHRDWPLRDGWVPAATVLSAEEDAAIAAIPADSPSDRPDAVLRMRVPYDFSPSEAARTLVFGTCEFRYAARIYMAGNQTLVEALASSDAVIVTPSHWSAAGFLAAGAAPERVAVIAHGVDIARFHPLSPPDRAARRRRAGFEGVVFLTIGALTANKGLAALLKAFAVVAQRHGEVRLLIKGADALYGSREILNRLLMREAVLTEREAAVISPRLHYIGETLDEAGMAELYGVADVYVTPYRGEGFNMPVLEAAACGLPVICTRGGATDDFVTDDFALRIDSTLAPAPLSVIPEGGGVQLVPRLEHLIELMMVAAERPDIGARARAAGPAFVARGFTWGHAVDRLVELAFPGDEDRSVNARTP